MTSLILLIAVAAAPNDAAATLTQLTAVAAALLEGAEVVSSRDIERIIELEAEKDLAGCTDDASACLAEVAGALGARLVVFGELGQLDDQLIVTLNLYDADQSRSVGRRVIRGEKSSAIAAQLDETIASLVGAPLKVIDSKEPVRVLVMDLQGGFANGVSGPEPPAPPGEPMPFMQAAGLVTAGGAILALGAGGFFGFRAIGDNERANAPGALQKDVPALEAGRNVNGWIANGLFLGGAALAVAGGSLYIMGGE